MLGTRFYRQTLQAFDGTRDLSYTIFDFGARAGRIVTARAQVWAANFAFNDTHRKLIYQVEEAYYRLLNASGQEQAARASLTNAQTVQQAAEDRLKNGLATLPDVLEARTATAQAEYELAQTLDAIADRIEGKPAGVKKSMLEDYFKRLEHTVQMFGLRESPKEIRVPRETFLNLARRVEQLATSLNREI